MKPIDKRSKQELRESLAWVDKELSGIIVRCQESLKLKEELERYKSDILYYLN
jgi:hypothetical protein